MLQIFILDFWTISFEDVWHNRSYHPCVVTWMDSANLVNPELNLFLVEARYLISSFRFLPPMSTFRAIIACFCRQTTSFYLITYQGDWPFNGGDLFWCASETIAILFDFLITLTFEIVPTVSTPDNSWFHRVTLLYAEFLLVVLVAP